MNGLRNGRGPPGNRRGGPSTPGPRTRAPRTSGPRPRGERHMREVVIVEAGRSAIGKRGGSLPTAHPADVLGPVQMEVLRRAGVQPSDVGQVVGGCINKVGAQAMNVTRTAWLSHGGAAEVACTTVDSQ